MKFSDDFVRLVSIACGALLLLAAGVVVGALYDPLVWPLRSIGKAGLVLITEWRAVAGLKPTEHLEPLRLDLAAAPKTNVAKMQPGVTFVTGLFGEKLGARLIGADGSVIYEWPIDFFDVMPEGKLYRFEALIHGAHLFENGDIVVNVDKKGMMRVSACGDILWSNKSLTHHSIDVDDEGFIWAPRGPVRKSDPRLFPHPFFIDEIVRIDPASGAEVEKFDLAEVYVDSGMPGRLTSLAKYFADTLHVNDVEVLDAADAAAFPNFSPGDIMISSWQNSSIVVIDRRTKTIKWSVLGATQFQHDPDFGPDGVITVLDNRGWTPALKENNWLGDRGGSRIAAIRPGDDKAVTLYQSHSGDIFYTPRRGKHQRLPNGDILITETDAGRAFEVDQKGEIVWSYLNKFDEDEVGWLMSADRYPPSYADIGKSCPMD